MNVVRAIAFFVLLASVPATAPTARASEDDQALTLESALAQAKVAPGLDASSRSFPFWGLERPPRPVPDAAGVARVEVMARFFDVLIVDLDEAAYAAKMSTAYGRWQRLVQTVPGTLDALRAHHAYMEFLSRLNRVRMNQRLARQALAAAMGNPSRIASELVEPELPEVAVPHTTEEAPSPLSRSSKSPWERELIDTQLELSWLKAYEIPRAKALLAVSARVLDEARARTEAGEPSDLGNASAASIEAMRNAKLVRFLIALGEERSRLIGPRASLAGAKREPITRGTHSVPGEWAQAHHRGPYAPGASWAPHAK